MRRLFIFCLLVFVLFIGVVFQVQVVSFYNLLVGIYIEGFSEGIQVYCFDGVDGLVKGLLCVVYISNFLYLIFVLD